MHPDDDFGWHRSAADPHDREENPTMDRPRPIQDAVKAVGSAVGALAGVVQTLVLLGVLSNEQAAQINELGVLVGESAPLLADSTSTIVAVVGGLITAGSVVLGSFAVARRAEPRVTPVESPQDQWGRELAPRVP